MITDLFTVIGEPTTKTESGQLTQDALASMAEFMNAETNPEYVDLVMNPSAWRAQAGGVLTNTATGVTIYAKELAYYPADDVQVAINTISALPCEVPTTTQEDIALHEVLDGLTPSQLSALKLIQTAADLSLINGITQDISVGFDETAVLERWSNVPLTDRVESMLDYAKMETGDARWVVALSSYFSQSTELSDDPNDLPVIQGDFCFVSPAQFFAMRFCELVADVLSFRPLTALIKTSVWLLSALWQVCKGPVKKLVDWIFPKADYSQFSAPTSMKSIWPNPYVFGTVTEQFVSQLAENCVFSNYTELTWEGTLPRTRARTLLGRGLYAMLWGAGSSPTIEVYSVLPSAGFLTPTTTRYRGYSEKQSGDWYSTIRIPGPATPFLPGAEFFNIKGGQWEVMRPLQESQTNENLGTSSDMEIQTTDRVMAAITAREADANLAWFLTWNLYERIRQDRPYTPASSLPGKGEKIYQSDNTYSQYYLYSGLTMAGQGIMHWDSEGNMDSFSAPLRIGNFGESDATDFNLKLAWLSSGTVPQPGSALPSIYTNTYSVDGKTFRNQVLYDVLGRVESLDNPVYQQSLEQILCLYAGAQLLAGKGSQALAERIRDDAWVMDQFYSIRVGDVYSEAVKSIPAVQVYSQGSLQDRMNALYTASVVRPLAVVATIALIKYGGAAAITTLFNTWRRKKLYGSLASENDMKSIAKLITG